MEATGVAALVAGIGVGIEGGSGGVQLLVPDECVAAALKLKNRYGVAYERAAVRLRLVALAPLPGG